MKIGSVIPILYSDDVFPAALSSISRCSVFTDHWGWGEPLTFGGVVDGDITIFFCKVE